MVIRDVRLTQVQIVSAKNLAALFSEHEPGCAVSFEGVKRDEATFQYRLRFLVDEDCLWYRQFPTDDMIGADFVIEDEDADV